MEGLTAALAAWGAAAGLPRANLVSPLVRTKKKEGTFLGLGLTLLLLRFPQPRYARAGAGGFPTHQAMQRNRESKERKRERESKAVIGNVSAR